MAIENLVYTFCLLFYLETSHADLACFYLQLHDPDSSNEVKVSNPEALEFLFSF